MSCQTGIKTAVETYVQNKPYLNFDGKDFIEVRTSPKEKVNPNNFYGVARSVADTLNKAINSDIVLGKIFYPKSYSDKVGVIIAPTVKQLDALNAKDQAELAEALAELDQEIPEANRLDLENDTTFGVNSEGDTTGLLQTDEVPASKASPRTISLVKDLLKRIGVDIKTLQNIEVNGVKQDVNGVADIMQKIVKVTQGKEDVALTEEAMHFVVEILEQKNPQLFNRLLGEINSYKMYSDVLATYGKYKQYQTPDGKPNIRKLKKEAIGKVLAETIIKKNEGSTEKPELLAKVESWWNTIVDFIKGLFVKSGFDQAAMMVLAGEEIGTADDIRNKESVFFQQNINTQQLIVDKLKLTSNQITKDDTGYLINGNRIKRRVTDFVKDWYSTRFANKDLTKSEYDQALDDLKKEKGTAGHADIEHMLKNYFLNEDGTLRPENERPDDNGYVSQLNPSNKDLYNILKRNMAQRLESFPAGTKFLAEISVYDASRDVAGTVDFIAVTPEGKVSILDWKFMELNVQRYKDVPWYKVNAWRQQMKQYKSIVEKAYGVKPEDFEQTRMIPIRAIYSGAVPKEGVLPQLTGVQIGDVDVKKEELAYLLPVGLETEKTDNKKLDTLIERLNKIYETISSKKATPEEKRSKAELLNSLYESIRQLQIRQNVEPLIKQAKLLNADIQRVIDTYNNSWKDKDANSFTDKQKNDLADRIISYESSLIVYKSLATDLKSLFKDKLSEKDQSLWQDIRNTAETAAELESDLEDVRKDFAENIIAKSQNVIDFLKPEKVIKGFSKAFGTTSVTQLKSAEILYKMTNRAFGLAAFETSEQGNILLDIKDKYDKWAKSKGLTNKNYFNIIKKKGKNELIDEYSPEFYKTLKSKIAQKDHEWVRDNIDVSKYNEFLKEQKEKELQRIEDKTRFGDEETIKRDKKREIAETNTLYNTSTTESPGWLLYDFVKKFPKQDKWQSEEWKELNKPENAPAKKFFDYIRDRNEYLEQIGYINRADARIFLPFVRKSLTEKIIMGGDFKLGESLLRNITITEGDVGYGQIDPITKEPVYSIPKYFTRETTEEASEDLFRNMTLLNQMAIRYEYLSNIENQLNLIIKTESNKEAIKTSYFGKTKYRSDGTLETTSDNTKNTQLVRDMMEAIVYGHKYVENENFDQLLGGISNFGKRANKLLGRKVFTEDYDDAMISLNKTITQLNNFFQLKTLGLNPISALSNSLGGSFQSFINAGKYFTKTDFVRNEFMMAAKMNGVDSKKYVGALQYFQPLTENYNSIIAKKLSLNKFSQEGVQDFLMILMRTGDQYIQSINFFSYLENSIVQDGKVFNVREYLKKQPEFENMFTGTAEERSELKDKFESEVKRLVSEKGFMKLAKVEGNNLVVEGLDRKSDSVIELRRKVQSITKDALGNLSEDDIRRINLNIYGKSFMVFKNWIPRLVDVRFGNLKYNSATEAYEWGRTRNMFRILTDDFTGSIDSLISSLKGDDQKFVEQIKKLYEAKKTDYERDTGKTLNMTQGEFVELVNTNVRNQMTDFMFYLTLSALIIGAKAVQPGDDDEKATKNRYKYMLRVMDKVRDEVAYFYNPTSFLSLTTSGIFPAVSYLENFRKLFVNFGKEMYALGVGDEELAKKTQVIKYLLKGFPIASQVDAALLMFFPDVAKDLGMKAQSEARPFGK
ncbi:MAG: hypothetical protein EBR30_06805 [Cytophagia bacterium]|nr:hypothetical protein [Cytophagia bacterium]